MTATTFGSSLSFPFSWIDELPRKKAGVYAIINLTNGKFYIGSSNSVSHRFSQHRHELKKGVHGNQYLNNAYKLEPTAFKFVVLEYVDAFQEIEQKLLDTYYDNQDRCYNLSASADRPKFCDETRTAISLRLIEKHRSDPHLREHLVNYNKTPEAKKLHSDHAKQQRRDPEFTKRLIAHVSRAKQRFHDVWVVDPNGIEYHVGWNMRQFCLLHGLNQANFSKMINGSAKNHLGWRLKQ